MPQEQTKATIEEVPQGNQVPPDVLSKLSLTRRKLDLLKLEMLRRVEMFQFFPQKTLETMASAFNEVLLKKDDLLFQEGDLANRMFIILAGSLQVSKQKKPIANRGPGEYIGEMALIDSMQRSGTVRALTDILLLEVGQEHFHKYLLADPQAVLTLMRTLSHRLRQDMDIMAAELQRLNHFTHDMRNCIVPLGISEILLADVVTLLQGKDKDQKPRVGIDKVQRCYDTMIRVRNNVVTLMDQSLACARKEKTEYVKESSNVVPLIEETIDEISCHKFLKDKNLKLTVSGEIGDCSMNPLDIKRVLQNLLINSGFASTKDGLIEVIVSDEGQEVQVAVRDQGNGIPEDVKPYLLRENYTSRPRGNGFGLMSCREIIEEFHNGRIWFESELGKGATFYFSLPRHP